MRLRQAKYAMLDPCMRLVHAVSFTWHTKDTAHVPHADMDAMHVCCMQVPLKLAWAITVHKSQGMSLDYVQVRVIKGPCNGTAQVRFTMAILTSRCCCDVHACAPSTAYATSG